MIRLLSSLVLVLCLACTAFAQADARDAKSNRMLEKAANNGRRLPVEMTVSDQVTAQAVLIPRVDARRIFGKEIADNYAVIEINMGNKSPDAAPNGCWKVVVKVGVLEDKGNTDACPQ